MWSNMAFVLTRVRKLKAKAVFSAILNGKEPIDVNEPFLFMQPIVIPIGNNKLWIIISCWLVFVQQQG